MARAVRARSAVTVSMSTPRPSRSANAAAVWSASNLARSKRRSTTVWTRRRTGWNNAAAARVDSATARCRRR